MYRVKRQVKARMEFIKDEQKKQVFNQVYEQFIKDLNLQIKYGSLDGVLEPYKIYIDVDLLEPYGMNLVYDYTLQKYLEEQGVPVLEIGWDRVRYDYPDDLMISFMTEIHRFYIEIDMIKIWALNEE